MRLEKADPAAAKGWYAGPWNWDLPIAVGYAHSGVDEPHFHRHMTEIYLVGQGCSEIRVEKETIALEAGDMLVLEPGEAHTFLCHSADYFQLVLHLPALSPEASRAEKVPIPRARLGL